MAYRVLYVLRDAKDGLLRHLGASLATVMVLAVTLFVLSGFAVVDRQLQGLALLLESQTRIRVFVAEGVNPQEVARSASTLVGVGEVRVETALEALERFRQAFPGASSILAALDRNPFPDAVIIEPHSADRVDEVGRAAAGLPGVTDAVWAQAYLPQVLAASNSLRSFGALGMAVLVATSFLVTVLTVHLNMLRRRDEIEIRLLVGASPLAVRGQFVVEGLLMGALGGLAGTVAGLELAGTALRGLEGLVPFLSPLPEASDHTSLVLIGTVLGTVQTLGASLAATYTTAARWGRQP